MAGSDRYDVVVVGAGVVGAACAAALAPRARVLIVDAADRAGAGVTSRSSGVVHAGLYYPPGSLKAETCIRGNALLWSYAQARGVWHARTGKLVITRGDPAALEALRANALASGARGLTLIDGA